MNLYGQIRSELDVLSEKGALRSLATVDCSGKFAEFNGRRMVNLSGNDYLGVAADPEWKAQYLASVDPSDVRSTLSAASSRLLTGNSIAYTELESALSRLYNGRSVLIFNSGYHANIGILPALAKKGDVIYSDKLNHASIIDGLKLCEAEHRRYPHGDLDALDRMMTADEGRYRNVFLVSESVFSMDGDVVSPRRLVEIKKRHNAFLVLDEAHAVGLFGPHSGGMADLENCVDDVDVLIGTLGKAFGSVGAYAVTAPEVREYLINRMRSLIFSTGLPPLELGWSKFVAERLPLLEERRVRLRRLSDRLRGIIAAKGLQTGGTTQIVPAVVGKNVDAVRLSERLREAGFLVFPIRPPTVPAGTARIRFSLSGNLEESDIEQLGEVL